MRATSQRARAAPEVRTNFVTPMAKGPDRATPRGGTPLAGVLDMRTFATGMFFVLHGLAHAAAGMAAQDVPAGLGRSLGSPVGVVLATLLFALAGPGFVAAGFGRWGVAGLRDHWQLLTRIAAVASVLLLAIFARPLVETALGILLDVLALQLSGLHGVLRRSLPRVPAGGQP